MIIGNPPLLIGYDTFLMSLITQSKRSKDYTHLKQLRTKFCMILIFIHWYLIHQSKQGLNLYIQSLYKTHRTWLSCSVWLLIESYFMWRVKVHCKIVNSHEKNTNFIESDYFFTLLDFIISTTVKVSPICIRWKNSNNIFEKI